jgi:hypothetical protein
MTGFSGAGIKNPPLRIRFALLKVSVPGLFIGLEIISRNVKNCQILPEQLAGKMKSPGILEVYPNQSASF